MSIINRDNITALVMRTLNHVDVRLMDHGKRVAYLMWEMLETLDTVDTEEKRDLCILAMMHDVGAYKTEEIDQMVRFETENIWEHSAYGFLFLRDLSPLREYAPIVLFHHLNYSRLRLLDTPHKQYTQMLNLADRVDVYLENAGEDASGLWDYLEQSAGSRFDPQVVELFRRTCHKRDVCRQRLAVGDDLAFFAQGELPQEELETYLNMLICTIDFRSYHTVSHTITTTSISRQLAALMGLDAQEQNEVRYGALLHDLGKIGIPVEILEYPGKLSFTAMKVMRTHVEITEAILGDSVDERVARIAVRHHEKLDGSGYPRGLTGEDLTLGERIVAVADIISALCGTRSYKEAFPKERTLEILDQMARDGLIDREVVAVAREHFDEIVDTVREDCRPTLEAYGRISGEYRELMDKLREYAAIPV